MNDLTPRAFDAILSQLTGKGYTEAEFDGEVRGAGWTALFETETDPYGGINGSHEVCSCISARLVGAWREDENGNLFAGDRDEVLAVVGDAEVKRWEALVAQ